MHLPPNLKQKIVKICKQTCLEPTGSIDLSCFYDCIVSGLIAQMKIKATLDKVFLAFALATNISPIELRDIIILGCHGGGYFIQYTCKSRRDVCEYLAMNAAEHLERLPGTMAVIAVFNHPVYELRLLPPTRL